MPRARLVLVLPLLLATCLLTSATAHARPDPGTSDGRADAVRVPLLRQDADAAAPARGVWPLRPRPAVAAGFDPPTARWGTGHRGVDLVGHVGQPVRAALPGRVGFVGRIAGRGVVVVDHGRTRTTYEPVLAVVPRGHQVSAGTVIGRLTGTGSHCAPRACLHWGLRRGEAYLDPLTLVDAPRPVRLLPW